MGSQCISFDLGQYKTHKTDADGSAFFAHGLDRRVATYILSYKDASDAWIDFGIPAFITFYEKTLEEVKKGK